MAHHLVYQEARNPPMIVVRYNTVALALTLLGGFGAVGFFDRSLGVPQPIAFLMVIAWAVGAFYCRRRLAAAASRRM